MLVKATYRNETRRFAIACDEKSLFPTWEQLYNQLYRIFPISSDIYLSTILFSPDASRNARIMVGREVHNAEQYNNCITFLPSSRSWNNPMLRFSVYDDTPHKATTRAGLDQIASTLPFSHIPPPPVIYSSSSSNTAPMDIDAQVLRPMEYDGVSREDVSRLIDNFKADLSRMLDMRFGHNQETSPSSSSTIRSQQAAPIQPPMCLSGTSGCQGAGLQCVGCHLPRCSLCPTRPWGVCSGGRLHLFTPMNSVTHTEESFPGPYHPAYIHSAITSPASVEESVPAQTQTSPTTTFATPNRSEVIHTNVRCDQCGSAPVGTRHKCLDCVDYDLCDICMAANGAEHHNPFHQFVGIEEPGRIVVHRVFDADTQDLPTPVSAPREQRSLVVHLASCDLCDSTIQGDRYKCLQCPDYDTCSTCFGITKEQHPHSFVKISKREDLILRNQTNRDIHYATCDVCKNTIQGIRYKCMHPDCPDYDLCAVCEAHPIPVHNPRHALLKMRHPDAFVPLRTSPRELLTPRPRSVVPVPPTTTIPSPQVMVPVAPTQPVSPLRTYTPPAPAPISETNSAESPREIQTPSLAFPIDTEDIWEKYHREAQEEIEKRQSLKEHHDKEMEQLREELATRTHQERLRLAKEEEAREATQITPPQLSLNLASSPPSLSLASPPPSLTSLLIGLDMLSTSADKLKSSPDMELSAVGSVRSESNVTTIASTESQTTEVAPEQMQLSAKLVEKHTELGTFPPGAEFVKSWLMANDGSVAWPNDTKLALVSHEGAKTVHITEPHVGSLAPGALTEVTTGELKAPEMAGSVKMSWQLRDGEKAFFGDLISFEVEVVEPDSDESMGSSSIIVPASAASDSTATRSLTTGRTQSTLSLISVPSDVLSDYADAADVTPISPSPSSVEYVVLYGSDSDD